MLITKTQRTLADAKSSDKIVLPGSKSDTVAGIPQAPILATHTSTATEPLTPAAEEIPRPPPTPPTPAEVHAIPPTPSTNTGNLPPTGTGFAATGPAPPPAPKRPRRRFRTFLLSLILLSTLSYAGGLYYSLVNDNFHDFFTEYVPYGEDAVAYFEERDFKKRFPSREYSAKNWPSAHGENKVTIGRSSGLSARVADETKESDLGHKGRHVSAVEDGGKPQPGKAQQTPSVASGTEKTQAVEAAKKATPAHEASAGAAKPEPTKPASAAPPAPKKPDAPTIDHLNVPQATEPVVQDLVKMVNNIITAINASPEASSKFSTIIQTMKGDLSNIIGEIGTIKDQHAHEAETKIKNAHTEFDTAAQELVRRLEQEMREQESKWREEYETEREKLSASYNQKLAAELSIANKVAAEKNQNALLEQEIALQKAYMNTVKSSVEEERNGRLAKLDALAQNVTELEQLTSEWNKVVDATLRTQHLQVAVEAVRTKVMDSDTPTPFLNELVALKELSHEDDLVAAAIASIHPQAYQRGTPSPAQLIDRFRRVAHEVRKASLLPEDAGVASHAASAVLSRLMFSKKVGGGGERAGGVVPQGGDVEATLARAEGWLEEGDLDAAAREMNGLRGWAGVLSRDWVGEVRGVLEVRQAVEVIAAEARLQSLLVD